MNMKKIIYAVTVSGIIALLPIQQVSAHVMYEDFITNPILVTSHPSGNSTNYFAPSFGILDSNYGWADAADTNWGDSHTASWNKFTITASTGAYIDLSIFNGTTPGGLVGGLKPAFSLYSGSVYDEAHDTADSHPTPTGKVGNWNALGDTTMGNDYGEVATIFYLAHVAQNQNNLSTTASLNHFFLNPGTYSVVVGGDCRSAACRADTPPRDFGVSLTVTAVPLPAAIWMMGASLMGLAGMQNRLRGKPQQTC